MSMPESIQRFLAGRRIAVAGVSRDGAMPANAIFRKLAGAGYEVFPVNPSADELEGTRCYHDLDSIPGPVDGVVAATHPNVSVHIVRQAAGRGVKQVWFHRSFGDGSVSAEAIEECNAHGIEPIVGGCPMMFCQPVDIAHKCMCWFLQWRGKVPK